MYLFNQVFRSFGTGVDKESQANANKIATTIAAIVNIAGVPHILYVGDSQVIKFSADRDYRLSPIDSEEGKLTNTLSLSTLIPQLSFIPLYQEWEKPPEFVLLTTDWIDVLPDSYGNNATSGVGKKPFLEAIQQMVKSGRSRLDIEKYIKSVIEKGVWDDATFILMQQDPETSLNKLSDLERGKLVFDEFVPDKLQESYKHLEFSDDDMEETGRQFDIRFDFPKLEGQVDSMLRYIYKIANQTKDFADKLEDFKTIIWFLYLHNKNHNENSDLNEAVDLILGQCAFELVFRREGESVCLNVPIHSSPFASFSWEIIELIQKIKRDQPLWFDRFVNEDNSSILYLGNDYIDEIKYLGQNFRTAVGQYEADNSLEGVDQELIRYVGDFNRGFSLEDFSDNLLELNSESVSDFYGNSKVELYTSIFPHLTEPQKQDKRYLAVIWLTFYLKEHFSKFTGNNEKTIKEELKKKYQLDDILLQWLFTTDDIGYGFRTIEHIFNAFYEGLQKP